MSYALGMRGGMARWKRGVASQGVHQALDYAFGGTCDASHDVITAPGAEAAAAYGDDLVMRYVATDDGIAADALGRDKLRAWIDGDDPDTGLHRGRALPSPDADLLLDATLNAPKSYSIAALLDDDLSAEFEALQDRLRDRVIATWQRELNARRGAGGLVREELARIEVVELKHERSRSLDPHKHRHLWLNMKVQGRDGKWSNLDSRVALKFQTVVNAEGDLAARTDPEWIAALAAKGYTLGADGEVEQLAHVVRPLSRRSNQIEANRALKLAEWHDENPGEEPSVDVMRAIDRWAWAHGRPNKPGDVDEADWTASVRAELAELDAELTLQRAPVEVAAVAIADLDRDALAAFAVANADQRAQASSGRFSVYDVRAGTTRALAASGVIGDREQFTELLEDITRRAIDTSTIDLIVGEGAVPGHVKALMASRTATLKAAVGRGLDDLVHEHKGPVESVDADTIAAIAATSAQGPIVLNEQQADAAGAIAGSGALVTVTGPAGTGKTTMLTVARQALENQGRRMVIAAPTKKAASVAGREVGAEASSLHALLLDHGWHTEQDAAGREEWRRYELGETMANGEPFAGPRRFVLQRGDRIVIDEAGMVDLGAARALVEVARDNKAGLALVGDQFQAAPVGHAGAMAMAVARAEQTVELEQVHRFRTAAGEPDTAYAQLSLRLRYAATSEHAASVAAALNRGGHVSHVSSVDEVRAHLVAGYFEHAGASRTVALVTATNETAQQVNETIQAERIRRGELAAAPAAFGQNDQALHVGDVVQTRRNSRDENVENRAMWRLAGRDEDGQGVVLENLHTPGDRRRVSAEYVAEHVHLAYASTVQGVQGETTDAAIVAGDVDASGLYVGMTRGRRHNEVVAVASTRQAAVDQVAETMLRGRIETELGDSRTAARNELSRAARAPLTADAVIPDWNSGERRYGHVVDVDGHLATVGERHQVMRDELGTIADRLSRDRRTLATVEAKLAEAEARNHQAAQDGSPLVDVAALEQNRDRLTVAVDEGQASIDERRGPLRKHSNTIERLQVEQSVRQRLTPDELQAEDAGRAQRMEQIRAGESAPEPEPEAEQAAPRRRPRPDLSQLPTTRSPRRGPAGPSL